MNDRPAARRPDATMNDLREILEASHNALMDLLDAVREQGRGNEQTLYCPPSDHCAGGVRLERTRQARAGQSPNPDKLFHGLPESEWHVQVIDGKEWPTRSHVVWRSKALRAEDLPSIATRGRVADATADERPPATPPSAWDEATRTLDDLLRQVRQHPRYKTAEHFATAFWNDWRPVPEVAPLEQTSRTELSADALKDAAVKVALFLSTDVIEKRPLPPRVAGAPDK